MALRPRLHLLALIVVCACDTATERNVETSSTPTAGVSAAPVITPAVPASVAGTYRVSGTTVERDGGSSRRIDGTIVMTQDGDRYRASFQLETLYPTPEGDHQATVIGKGEGSVQNLDLAGTAQTQIVVAAVPGVDTNFAFAPRAVTTRIQSNAKGSLTSDGKLVIEIDNVPLPGEKYRPTHTRLMGERLAPTAADPPKE